jgi:hypothetical protein
MGEVPQIKVLSLTLTSKQLEIEFFNTLAMLSTHSDLIESEI